MLDQRNECTGYVTAVGIAHGNLQNLWALLQHVETGGDPATNQKTPQGAESHERVERVGKSSVALLYTCLRERAERPQVRLLGVTCPSYQFHTGLP